jgi:hypothetical protein
MHRNNRPGARGNGDGDAVPGADECGVLRLEIRHLLAADECCPGQHLLPAVRYLVSHGHLLGVQVNERNYGQFGSFKPGAGGPGPAS